MKFPRYLLSLCAIFFITVAVSANAEVEEVDEITEVEARNPLLLRAAMVIIKKAVKWAAEHCVKEAANNCKQHWKHPKALASCGKNFLQANKGRCVAG